MANTKKRADLCVAIATYTDEQGNQKTQYENIGVEMINEHGRFIFLKPYTNLSGFEREAGKMVCVSIFEEGEKNV